MAIPVIDLSKLDGDERANTMAQIHNCCQDWGFFQLVNHGMPEELLERVKNVCSDCFKLEREEGFNNSEPVKLLNEILEKQDSCRQTLEGVDWEDVFTLLDDNDWPSAVPSFRETMAEYKAHVKELAEKITRIMDENLGLPLGYIRNAFNGDGAGDTAFFGTKVCHYPPCPRPELINGLRAHTDAGGVVLLFQDDQTKGLQILKDGAWIDVQPIPHAIVINTGDQIEVLSNGRYKSVWHRVLATPDGNRRSIASFYNPSLNATIAPAPRLVEKAEAGATQEEEEECKKEEEPFFYPKFVFGDYMSVYAEQKFLPKEPRFHAVRAV